MFIRSSLKTLSLAAAVAVMAGSGPALAQEGGDGSLRVMQPLSERVAQAEAESVSFGELFSGQGRQQAAIAGEADARSAETREGIHHPTHSGFQHEAWRDLPPRR